MEKEAKIRYGIGWLGAYIDGYIFLNENLKKYPKVHDVVLEHEMHHHKDWLIKGNHFYSKKDFFHDLKDLFSLKWQLATFWFQFRHPTSMLPIVYYQKEKNKMELGIVLWPILIYFIVLISIIIEWVK